MNDKSSDDDSERAKDLADIGGLLEKTAFPLSKRELFAAFYGMGLASRLQPLHITGSKDSLEHQARVVALSFQLADMSIAESAKEPKAG